jgi:acyl-homoserine lactone acylase PvdQ
VHLVAPGWNVIGATAPWRPGVAVGHNDRLAWGTVPTASADAIDILEEPIDAVTGTPFTDRVNVRGRAEPFTFETQVTPHGIVIATDANRGRVFTLRWAGAAAGCAPELAALTLDRAGTFDQMRAAVATWRMPPVRFSVSDAVSSQSMGDDHGRPRESSARGPSRALFASPLGITDAARRRFDVGPIARPDRDQPFQAGFDPRAWDDSHVVNAPGQSETPDSAHFADLARLWSAGEMFPLAFSESAVQAAADTTLMLLPAGARRSP